MSLEAATKAIRILEREQIRIVAMIATQGTLRTDLSADEMKALDAAFGTPELAHRFLTTMPSKPGAKAILAAFDPAQLDALVNTTLGGDMRALGVLAEMGCDGNAAKLKQFADEFEGNTDFQTVFIQAGLNKRPDTMAALLRDGCNGDPKAFAKLVERFKDADDARKLDAVLGAGGLGAAPRALGALVQGDDGAMLQSLTQQFMSDDDLSRLNTVLSQGGLDGRAPGRPDMLSDVIRKGLGGRPERLKDLHDAFHSAPGAHPVESHMAQMGRMLDAFDGTDSKAGERLNSALEVQLHNGAANNAQAAQRLRDPWMSTLETMGRGNGTPDIAQGTDKAVTAALAAPPPPPEAVASSMAGLIGPGGSMPLGPRDLALVLGHDMANLTAAQAMLDAQADQIAMKSGGEPDPDYSQATREATEALGIATDALLKPVNGPDPAQITALEDQAATLLQRCETEPDKAVCDAALAVVRKAADAIQTALSRIAAQRLGQTGAAAVDLVRVQTLRAGASDAEKAALETLSRAAMEAAVASAASHGDPDAAAADAKARIDAIEGGDPLKESTAANDAADAATKAARAAAAELSKAPAPVNPALLARASAAAAAAAQAGRLTPDPVRSRACFDAAKLAADAVAQAAGRAAMASKLGAAHDSAYAAEALSAGADCDQSITNLRNAGLDAQADSLETAAEATRAGALLLAEAERLRADATAGDVAKDAVLRRAGDTDGLGAGTAAARQAAESAEAELIAATAALDGASVSDANYADLISDLQARARAVLEAAKLVQDDAARNGFSGRAIAAINKVAAASKALSASLLADATTELANRQGASTAATAAASRALRDDYMPGGTGTADPAALAGQVDDLRNKMAEAANALLADQVMTDPAAIGLRKDAAKAAANASVPGAGFLAIIRAAEAKRDADKKMTELAFAMANTHIANLPAPPTVNGAAPLTTAHMGMNPDAAFRTAAAAFEAANSAAAKWRESANAVVREIETALKQIDPADPDHATVTGLKAAAETEVQAALDKQREMKPTGAASPLAKISKAAGDWSKWVNQKGHSGTAEGADLLATAGAVRMFTAEGRKAHVAPSPRDELIRVAAMIRFDPYTVGTDADSEDCTFNPNPTPAPAVPLPPQDAKIRKRHICGRHVREAFEFGNELAGGPHPDNVAAGRMIAAQFAGVNGTLPAAPNKLRQLIASAESRGTNKVNSFLPEGVNKGNVSAVVGRAMAEVRKLYTDVPALLAAIGPAGGPPNGGGWLVKTVTVDIPPPEDVTIGMKNLNGKVKADMVYGTIDTIPMADMMTIGRAIGV